MSKLKDKDGEGQSPLHVAAFYGHEEIVRFLLESLEMSKKIFGDKPHPEVATSLNNIGFAYGALGDSQKALEFYLETLEMTKKIYGDKPHPDVAISLNNIGGAYYALGDSQRALEFYLDTLEMTKKTSAASHTLMSPTPLTTSEEPTTP